ncbi:MAG: aromatic ring-hydroxylating dioxygenase subunit alpha [Pseudohongiellaceae bacterium]
MSFIKSNDTLNKKRIRSKSVPVPNEGEDGIFSESWFPVCLSKELKSGCVIGRPFLDGRVVIFRSNEGIAQVLSAYCPHLGADLAVGKVIGDHIQCGFHRWEFNQDGWCDKTGLGDEPPEEACLYKFHTVEKFGFIWAFNGDTPWWDIPDYPKSEDELEFLAIYDVPVLPVDPWVVCANTPDWQHLKAVHRLKFNHEWLYDKIDWTDHSMEYDMEAKLDQGEGPPLNVRVGIYGTSFFRLHGEFMGQWICAMTAFHLLEPGKTQVYFSLGTTKSDGSPEDDARVTMAHNMLFQLGKSIVTDDRAILHSINYQPGVLTKSDKALAKYLGMVRNFPRSHDSSSFIK